jgi:hypothetical protein
MKGCWRVPDIPCNTTSYHVRITNCLHLVYVKKAADGVENLKMDRKRGNRRTIVCARESARESVGVVRKVDWSCAKPRNPVCAIVRVRLYLCEIIEVQSFMCFQIPVYNSSSIWQTCTGLHYFFVRAWKKTCVWSVRIKIQNQKRSSRLQSRLCLYLPGHIREANYVRKKDGYSFILLIA